MNRVKLLIIFESDVDVGKRRCVYRICVESGFIESSPFFTHSGAHKQHCVIMHESDMPNVKSSCKSCNFMLLPLDARTTTVYSMILLDLIR